MSKFLKGLAHDFPQKFENSSQSHFLWKIPTHDLIMFSMKKKRFPNYKNVISKCWENVHLSKGVKPWFSSNFQSFYESHLVRKRSRHMFYNVLKGKKGFLDYKNVNLTVWKCPFFSTGLPHDFRQKLDISSESHFLWKRPKHNV